MKENNDETSVRGKDKPKVPSRQPKGMPSNSDYDVRGMGEQGDPGIPGQAGKNPTDKPNDWA